MDTAKIIGILGGYGPYATSDFYKTLLDNTETVKDWDHFHAILDVNPRIPSRARSFLFGEEDPTPHMIKGIERLKVGGADFFVCPCNTAHYFLKKSEHLLELPFLNMIDAVVSRIVKSNIDKIGVLGSEVTVMGKLYEEKLIAAGIEVDNVDDLKDVRYIIEAGKQNANLPEARELMLTLIDKFRSNDCKAVIYACTELPIILPIKESILPVFDSSQILAEETIKYAKN